MPTQASKLETIARLICEVKGYDPDAPAGENRVQWQTFTELAEQTQRMAQLLGCDFVPKQKAVEQPLVQSLPQGDEVERIADILLPNLRSLNASVKRDTAFNIASQVCAALVRSQPLVLDEVERVARAIYYSGVTCTPYDELCAGSRKALRRQASAAIAALIRSKLPCRKCNDTRMVQENSGPPVRCDLCAAQLPVDQERVELLTGVRDDIDFACTAIMKLNEHKARARLEQTLRRIDAAIEGLGDR